MWTLEQIPNGGNREGNTARGNQDPALEPGMEGPKPAMLRRQLGGCLPLSQYPADGPFRQAETPPAVFAIRLRKSIHDYDLQSTGNGNR